MLPLIDIVPNEPNGGLAAVTDKYATFVPAGTPLEVNSKSFLKGTTVSAPGIIYPYLESNLIKTINRSPYTCCSSLISCISLR